MKDLRLDNITASGKMAKGVPTRFTLPDVSKAVAAGPSVPYKATSKPLADIHFEFGVVAPAREHAEYRYTYGVSDRDRKSFMADISKIDTWTGRVQTWSAPATFTGEPRFIPDPNGTREDDGSLVILTLDTESKNSALVILDASTMKEVARAVVPSMIPLGFHGSCYPTE